MTDQQRRIVEEWFYGNCERSETWAQISLDELRTICEQVIECDSGDSPTHDYYVEIVKGKESQR